MLLKLTTAISLFSLASSLMVPSISHSQSTLSRLNLQAGIDAANEARQAYAKDDLATSKEKFIEALKYRPDHPGLIYNLAVISATMGDQKAALDYVKHYADLGLYSPGFENQEMFGFIANNSFINNKLKNNLKVFGLSQKLVSSRHELGLVEGVTTLPNSDDLIVSAYHDRKVYRLHKTGDVSPLFEDDRLLGPMALKWGHNRRSLYVTSSALPQIKGYDDSLKGKSLIFKLDSQDGYKVADLIDLNDKFDGDLVFGDMIVLENGDILASNSAGNQLFRIKPDHSFDIIEIDNSLSLQGLSVSRNQQYVYVADYSTGIHWLNLADNSNGIMMEPDNASLLTIDGVYAYQNSLIVVQNGVQPNRVLQLTLDTNPKIIKDVKVLAANHPDYEEPTLGHVVGDSFIYVANSQWPKFTGDYDEQTNWRDHLKPLTILSLPLK